MAKQQVSTGGSLIAASANLASSQVPVDAAGEFMKTFGAATKQYEDEQNAIKTEVKGWLSQLKSDVDFTEMSPEMENEVRTFLTSGRTEYSQLANEIAKMDDPSSEAYQQKVGRMNEIQREFVTLSKELQSYNQEKVNTATNIDKNNVYSGYNPDLAMHQSIYGLSDKGHAKMSINKGHLSFNYNGEDVQYNSLKPLNSRSKQPLTILAHAGAYSKYKVAMTQEEINAEKQTLTDNFADDQAFLTTVFDGGENLNLVQIKDKVIEARKSGTLDSKKMSELKNEAIDLIVTGYTETANEGVSRHEQAKIDDETRTTFKYGDQLVLLKNMPKAGNGKVQVGSYRITWDSENERYAVETTKFKGVDYYDDYATMYKSVSELQKRVEVK